MRTSANGQPSATANAPSVLGRSPTISSASARHAADACVRTASAIGAYGLPAIDRLAPDAVATAARIAPPPGIGPSGVGYVASSLVATSRAPSRTAVVGDAQPLVVELAVEADHHGVDVDAGRVVAGDRRRADAPRPPRRCPVRRTRAPARRRSTSAAAADRRRHHVAVGRDADRRQRRLLVGDAAADELLVTNTTRRPPARSRATASTEPGIGSGPARPRRRGRTARQPDRAGVHGRGTVPVGRAARLTSRVPPPEWRVPRFEPFRALRYAAAVDLDAVIAPPYDVLSDADVDALAARDDHNIVHVDVPRGGDDRYDVAGDAAAVVDRRRHDGRATTRRRSRSTACASPTPPGAGRDLVGVLGGLEVVDEGAGGVLPHERTTPKASTDRLDLTRATEANLSPVWGLSLARRPHRAARASRASRSARSPSTASSTSSNGSPTPTGSPRSATTSAATTC